MRYAMVAVTGVGIWLTSADFVMTGVVLMLGGLIGLLVLYERAFPKRGG